jgi:hypothetical protein
MMGLWRGGEERRQRFRWEGEEVEAAKGHAGGEGKRISQTSQP